MSKVAGTVDWGLKVETRTDLFQEKHSDAVVLFGKNRGKYLSECSRHWLAWVYVVKLEAWPQALLDLVADWGKRKSLGKDEMWGEIVDRVKLAQETAQGNNWA